MGLIMYGYCYFPSFVQHIYYYVWSVSVQLSKDLIDWRESETTTGKGDWRHDNNTFRHGVCVLAWVCVCVYCGG